MAYVCFPFQESRKLKFWYVDGTDYYNQVTTAYEFFKELVRPENFPRGKLMVLAFFPYYNWYQRFKNEKEWKKGLSSNNVNAH